MVRVSLLVEAVSVRLMEVEAKHSTWGQNVKLKYGFGLYWNPDISATPLEVPTEDVLLAIDCDSLYSGEGSPLPLRIHLLNIQGPAETSVIFFSFLGSYVPFIIV